MKNILVTGGCGFIGSNFVNYLTSKFPNFNVINIDALYYCSSLNNVTVDKLPNYKFYKCNIGNSDMIKYILEENNIDTVVHFAAQSHVDNSFGNSIQFTVDNVLGTHTLLECCRVWGKIERFIHISTDEVYGEIIDENEFCVEERTLRPTNPYAATKASAEHLVFSYHYSFKLPIIITRGNNVYGPNQYPEKIIPLFTKLLKEGKKCTIHGEGKSVRNFIYVEDVCRAVETIMFSGKIGQIYNIGTECELSVLQVAKILVEKIYGNDEDYKKHIEFVEDRKFNDIRYAINSDKLRGLGWEEKIGFEEGLKRTLESYEK
jgi:dTDP-glucose 4,6-dehydratase